MIYRFWGAEVCCGTYACMNYLTEIGDTRIHNYKDFEIATSVPFGICYKERPRYDRLLTPVCNPNQGINRAAVIYGYEVEQYDFQTLEELIVWLKENLVKTPVILGPVDMGKLFYLPMSEVYKSVDHYIVLSYISENQIAVIDSEGIGRIACTYEDLKQWISIQDILEANQLLTLRRLIWKNEVTESEIIEGSWSGAVKNYKYVSISGENSFFQCGVVAEKIPTYIWKNSLLYESAAVFQRKLLFFQLLDSANMAGIIERCKKEKLKSILKIQCTILEKLFWQIRVNQTNWDIFNNLGMLEKEICEEIGV